MKKYPSSNFEANKYVDLPTREIALLMRDESTTLERTDLKAIIMELCFRVEDALGKVEWVAKKHE